MTNKVTNEELARMIKDGFDNTVTKQDMAAVKQDMVAVKQDVSVLRQDMAEVKGRITAVEAKLDRALYKELDRYEHWIRLLAEKIGIELSR